MMQLVDNAEVGGRLVNAHWRVYRLGADDSSLLLGDRPLIPIGGCSSEECVWALPLSPSVPFVAANAASVAANFDRPGGTLLRQRMNESTMN